MTFCLPSCGLSLCSAFSFDLMKHCWEEKPQSRPSFSSLVISVGNMLTEDYKKVPGFFIFRMNCTLVWLSLQNLLVLQIQFWLSVTVVLCVSVTSRWLRTSWMVINQLWFDREQLEIKLTERWTVRDTLLMFLHKINTDQFIDRFMNLQDKLTVNTLCVVYRKSRPSGERSPVGGRARRGRPLPRHLHHPHHWHHHRNQQWRRAGRSQVWTSNMSWKNF